MKKFKIFLASLSVLALVAACDDDGGTSAIDVQTGGVPDIDKIEDGDPFIDLISIQEGGDFTIGVTLDKGLGDIASMDLVGFYKKASSGDTERVVLEPNVTVFPSTFTYSKADLIAAFNTLNANEDFELGDQLIISAQVYLSDGSSINILTEDGLPNYGQDIANSSFFSVQQSFTVSCPSSLGGMYNASTTASSTDPGPSPSENPIANFPYEVEVVDNGGGNYTISDAFGGVYILWYDIYGLDFEVPGTFSDVCGTISGSFGEPFQTTVTYTGSVDAATGVITINWINGFDDQGTTILTPQ